MTNILKHEIIYLYQGGTQKWNLKGRFNMFKSREKVQLGDFIKRGCTYYEVIKIEIFRSERQEDWEKTYRFTLKYGW